MTNDPAHAPGSVSDGADPDAAAFAAAWDRLTPLCRRFIDEYLIDLVGGKAAERAGSKAKSCRDTAHHWLQQPDVQLCIAYRQKERGKAVGATAHEVLARLWAIATADAREVIAYQRRCCRYCYGKGHKYQRTAAELAKDRDAHVKTWANELASGATVPKFDVKGGAGFNPRRDPRDDCPECFGRGIGEALVTDTRDLSPAGAALYAGVKTTREGIEVKLQDRVAALEKVGQHLGMFLNRIAGADGGALEIIGKVTRELVDPAPR
jgi:phage terminase small subunit